MADRKGRSYRLLGWTYLMFLAAMMFLKGKDYCLTPIYPLLFAAGGVLWEQITERHFRWILWVIAVVVIAFGCLMAPFDLPILSPGTLLKYQAALNSKTSKTEIGQRGLLPQHFGDEFGWEEMVATVSQIYHSLPPEEQVKTAIFTRNYGEAGAIDFLGLAINCPKRSVRMKHTITGARESISANRLSCCNTIANSPTNISITCSLWPDLSRSMLWGKNDTLYIYAEAFAAH